MGYWEGDSYVDGVGFVAWLERHHPERLAVLGAEPGWSDRLSKWRCGHRARAHIDTVDMILVRFGSRPEELPDELWKVPQTHHGRFLRCRKGHDLPNAVELDYRGRRVCPTCREARKGRRNTGEMARAQERQARARALRDAGRKWSDIAAELGYSCPGAAYTAARAAAQREPVTA